MAVQMQLNLFVSILYCWYRSCIDALVQSLLARPELS